MGVQLADGQQRFADFGDVNFSDSELTYPVRDALKAVGTCLLVQGNKGSYEELIGVLHYTHRLAPDDVAMLVTSLKALSGAVSYINSDHHQELLGSISNMSLWNYGPDVMDVLVELIVSLAAVSGKYLHLCLDMLVKNFMSPKSFLKLLGQPRGLVKKEQVLSRVHSALRKIADMKPLAPSTLEQVIKERLPFKTSKDWILSVMYVENMLRLESGPMGQLVGRSMLMEVVNRLVELDVEIGWDDLSLDDSSKDIFEMELEDRGLPENEAEELLKESSNKKILSESDAAEHLDELMRLTFEHLNSCYESGRLSQVFETLMGSFQSTVLTAYKSKFSQFVMFYACSLDPEDCGVKFTISLANIFGNTSYPPEWRMGAVAYLASYLSRAKFLSASYVITILESLVDWCKAYCENQDGDSSPTAHRAFYSGFQAVMYIFCFRMRSLLGVPRLKSQLFLMPIEDILKHSLNPLKVCLPSIVHEFMKQAKAAGLFNVSENFPFYDMLESELSRAFGGLERLDMFFPFDPYLLRNSDRFIRPNFIYWSLVRTPYDDDDEDEDDHQSEVSINEDIAEDDGNGVHIIRDEGIAMSFDDLGLDEFDNSMNKMSITPKNYRMQMMPSRIRPSASPESL